MIWETESIMATPISEKLICMFKIEYYWIADYFGLKENPP